MINLLIYNSKFQAVGFGYAELTREIVDTYPDAVHIQDNDGRTPLHYAATLRDDEFLYNFLLNNGADETKQDNVL